MNTNGRFFLGGGAAFLAWALLTGAALPWRLVFIWISLWALKDFMLIYWAHNLSCSVELRERGGRHEGDFAVAYVFANNGLLPVPFCQVEIHLEKELGQLNLPTESLSLAVGEMHTLNRVFRCPRRGVYRVGGAALILWDILGHRQRRLIFDKRLTVEVFPRRYPVEALREPGREEGGGLRGGWETLQDYSSMRNIREALPQESARHVHWKASARTEELQVKEYEARTRHGVILLLDSCRGKYPDDGGQTEERCVEVAAGLTAYWLYRGYSLELVLGRHRSLALHSADTLEEVLRELMNFAPQEEASMGMTVGPLRQDHREGSLLQVVTPALSDEELFSLAGIPGQRVEVFHVGHRSGGFPPELHAVEIPVQ